MGWCALIRRMHMVNHCRQHIGKVVYTVTVCEVVTACICMYVCMYVRMYVHVCVVLLSRCVQQLKPKAHGLGYFPTQYSAIYSRPLQIYQTRWSKSYTRLFRSCSRKFASLCNLAVNADEGTVFDYINSQ